MLDFKVMQSGKPDDRLSRHCINNLRKSLQFCRSSISIIDMVIDDILFVVYTERVMMNENGTEIEITRLISARQATNFERGLYYGKYI